MPAFHRTLGEQPASPYYTRETHPLSGPLPFTCEGEVHCCHGSISLPWQEFCTFPVNRFRVSAKFSAICTVPDALGVDGTRSTFFPRYTVFAFPSTFSPSFQLFSPSFQLFALFRTRWPLTGHVPSGSPFSPGSTFSRFRPRFWPPYTCFQLFSPFRTCCPLTGQIGRAHV